MPVAIATRLVPGREPNDCALCVLAMYLDLQGSQAANESRLGLMRDTLPPELFEFLAPRGSEWEAPIEGAPFAQPAIPGPQVLDLRGQPPVPEPSPSPARPIARLDETDGVLLGSNNRIGTLSMTPIVSYEGPTRIYLFDLTRSPMEKLTERVIDPSPSLECSLPASDTTPALQ